MTGLIGALLVFASLDLWFESATAIFDGRTVQLRRGFLGGRKLLEFCYEDIESIRAARGMRQGTKLYYDIELRPRPSASPPSGKLRARSQIVGRSLPSQREAQWLVDEMEECLGAGRLSGRKLQPSAGVR